MTALPTHQVRQNVHRILAAQGADLDQISESILIRDGFYCGRRFCAAKLQAVWFVEENELKVYDQAGALLMVTAADAVEQTESAEEAATAEQSATDASPLRRAA